MPRRKYNTKDITTAELQIIPEAALALQFDAARNVWYYRTRRYRLGAKELQQAVIQAITKADYSFDGKRWFRKKTPVEEYEVKTSLIGYAQTQKIAWAGIWADAVLIAAKEMPK